MSWVISCATYVLVMLYSFLCFCYVTWAHLLCEAATTDFLLGYCVSRQAHTHKSMMTLLQLIGTYLKHYPVKPLESARYIGFNLLKECSYPPQPSCATGIRLCLTSRSPILQQYTPMSSAGVRPLIFGYVFVQPYNNQLESLFQSLHSLVLVYQDIPMPEKFHSTRLCKN